MKLEGAKNVIVFYECYLNTIGGRDDRKVNLEDVPLLLCRGGGWDGNVENLSTKTLQISLIDRNDSIFELSGPTLPSASRDIYSAVSQALVYEESATKEERKREKLLNLSYNDSNNDNNNDNNSSDSVSCGSHGFVVKLDPHDGDERKKTNSSFGNARNANLCVGDTTSAWFNGGSDSKECAKGDVFIQAIWDCTSPNTIIYMTEIVSAALLS